ncbi:hypothetical protein [Streptomyces sp. NPDC048385]|uniref:hypothetical protein n=1 Tax=unclassified Streptomyces TaxID=2593676 RepID=UPI0034371B70
MFETVGDAVLLVVGAQIAWMGCWSWRRPERVPGLMAGAPAWAVRCGAVGWVLMGMAVCSFSGLGLAGRKEEGLIGLLHTAGVLLVFLSTVVSMGSRWCKRRTDRTAG